LRRPALQPQARQGAGGDRTEDRVAPHPRQARKDTHPAGPPCSEALPWRRRVSTWATGGTSRDECCANCTENLHERPRRTGPGQNRRSPDDARRLNQQQRHRAQPRIAPHAAHPRAHARAPAHAD
jgi:hypothetical protein